MTFDHKTIEICQQKILQSFQMNKNVAVAVFESKKQAEKCVKKYNR